MQSTKQISSARQLKLRKNVVKLVRSSVIFMSAVQLFCTREMRRLREVLEIVKGKKSHLPKGRSFGVRGEFN